MRYHIVKQSRGYKGGTEPSAHDNLGNPLVKDSLEVAIQVCDTMSQLNPVGYEVHKEKEFNGKYSEPIYVYPFKK